MFLDHWSLICSRHKEETLTFLTVKTAAVRCGAKPAELLRVPLCGRAGILRRCRRRIGSFLPPHATERGLER